MTVQVNRAFAEIAKETKRELKADLIRAVEQAFPERAHDAEQLVESATQWMGRNIGQVAEHDNPPQVGVAP